MAEKTPSGLSGLDNGHDHSARHRVDVVDGAERISPGEPLTEEIALVVCVDSRLAKLRIGPESLWERFGTSHVLSCFRGYLQYGYPVPADAPVLSCNVVLMFGDNAPTIGSIEIHYSSLEDAA